MSEQNPLEEFARPLNPVAAYAMQLMVEGANK
mgnify:FL=1